jgi:hypothetical protein
MRLPKHLLVGGAVVIAMAATTAAALGATHRTNGPAVRAHHVRKTDGVQLGLTPSSAQLAACMPGAQLSAEVALTTDEHGFDRFEITAHHLPPNRDFTIFLLEQAGAPFGAAQYIGDFSTDAYGNAHNNLKLIVQEAFASTLVNGSRVRVDLNRVGVWFADPADDDFCLGANSPVTPFDGDNAAGVQAFNSANAEPLPAP